MCHKFCHFSFNIYTLKNFQVLENCCSDDGKKWKDIFKGVQPGHVCCNAPCNQMESNHCPLPDHCNKIEGRTLGNGGVEEASTRSVGIECACVRIVVVFFPLKSKIILFFREIDNNF